MLSNSRDGFVYIGSTSLDLRTRFSLHRSNAKHNAGRPLYRHMQTIGPDCWTITEIDSGDWTREEIRAREQNEINNHSRAFLLNKNRAFKAR